MNLKTLYGPVLAFSLAAACDSGTQQEQPCNTVNPDPAKDNTWFCISCDEDKRMAGAVFNRAGRDLLLIGNLAPHPQSGETVFMPERQAEYPLLEEPVKQAMQAYCETGQDIDLNEIVDLNALERTP